MSTAVLAAQESRSAGSTSGSQSDQTVVYRGCLNLGTADGTFFMSKATEKNEKNQKGKEKISLKVTPASDKVKLEPFVLKEVEITGTVEAPAAASSVPAAEGGEVLGTLKATKITWKNDYCG
jgi:hypothetical protein